MNEHELHENYYKFLTDHPSEYLLKYTLDAEEELMSKTVRFLYYGLDASEFKEEVNDVCGHVFKKGEPVYHCYTCGIDPTCVLCSKCFNATKHDGHKVSVMVSSGSGGCCDCGDEEAFKVQINCKYHSASGSAIPTGGSTSQKEVWDETKANPNYRTLSARLDAIMDFVMLNLGAWFFTKGESPFDMDSPLKVKTAEQLKAIYGEEAGEYGLVLWNDETHSFNHVTSILKAALDLSETDSQGVAERVDRKGRDIIFTSTDLSFLISVAKQITSIELSCSIRPSHILVREEMSHSLLVYILEECHKNSWVKRAFVQYLFKVSELSPSLEQHFNGSYDEFIKRVFKEGLNEFQATCVARNNSIYSATLNDTDMKELSDFGYENSVSKTAVLNLDLLLLFDVKLWKMLRKNITANFVAYLLQDTPVKKATSIRFYFLYDLLARYFIFMDRESELSIYLFSLQLLTTPSISIYLQRNYRIFERILLTLKAFYLHQQNLSPANVTVTDFEKNVNCYEVPLMITKKVNNCGTKIFARRSKLFHTYSDLKYIIGALGSSQVKVIDSDSVKCFIDFIKIFEGMNEQKKQTLEHVLYEDPTWTKAFETSMQLGPVISSLSSLISHDQVMVKEIVDFILENYGKFNPDSKETHFSFHHPLIWFLGHLCAVLNDKSVFAGKDLSDISNVVLDTMVLCAEVRAGKWTRNGDVMKNQLYNYRSSRMWDFSSDIELYMLQTLAFANLERGSYHEFLMNVEIAFGVRNILLTNALINDAVEQRKNRVMVEEFLLVSIGLVTNNVNMRNDPEYEMIVELLTKLCAGPARYSYLKERLPDRLEKYHEEGGLLGNLVYKLADLKFPDLMSNGTFEIKNECLSEFYFPYLPHSSSSSREKASDYIGKKLLKDKFDYTKGLKKWLKQAPPNSISLLSSDYYLTILASTIELMSNNSIIKDVCYAVISILTSCGRSKELFETKYNGKTLFARFVELGLADFIEKLKSVWPDRIEASIPRPQEVTRNDADKAKELIRKRQEEIMKTFAGHQSTFTEKYKDLFEEVSDSDEEENMMEDVLTPQAFGNIREKHKFDNPVCILCQETLGTSSSYGLLCFVQASNIVKVRNIVEGELEERNISLPFYSTCGHLMHSSCFADYIDNIEQRQNQNRFVARAQEIENEENQQFLCPLCKTVGNSFLPVVDYNFEALGSPLSFTAWCEKVYSSAGTEDKDLYLDSHQLYVDDDNNDMNGNLEFSLESVFIKCLDFETKLNEELKRDINNRREFYDSPQCVFLSKVLYSNVCLNEINYRKNNIASTYSNFLVGYYMYNYMQNGLVFGEDDDDFVADFMHNKRLLQYDPFEIFVIILCYYANNKDFAIKNRKNVVKFLFIVEMTRALHMFTELPTITHEGPSFSAELRDKQVFINFVDTILFKRERGPIDYEKAFQFVLASCAVYLRRVDILLNHYIMVKEDIEEDELAKRVLGCSLETLLREFLASDVLKKIICRASENFTSLNTNGNFVMDFPGDQYSLFKGLPKEYRHLLELDEKCERCNQVPLRPAFCLICGQLLCSETICCVRQDDESDDISRHIQE